MGWAFVIIVTIIIIIAVVVRNKNKVSVSLQGVTDKSNFKPNAIIIDTETTGLVLDNSIRVTKKNVSEYPNNFPKIVQICYMLIDKHGNYEGEVYYIKQKEKIPPEAVKIHGITDETCETKGIELTEALKKLSVAISDIDTIVGHNVAFDYKVLHAEYLKNGIPFPLLKKNKVDTMRLTVKQLGFKPGFKISLYNSAEKLFGKNKEWNEVKSKFKKHDAESDVFVTALIYLLLKDKFLSK